MSSLQSSRPDSDDTDERIICLSPTEMDEESLHGPSATSFVSLNPPISVGTPASSIAQDVTPVPEPTRRTSIRNGMGLRRGSEERKTIAQKREVSVPRITMTPPHTPVHAFFDMVAHPSTTIANSPDSSDPSSPASSSSSSSSSPSSAYTIRSPDDSWSPSESSSPRPSTTKESVWTSIAALLGNVEYEPMQSSSTAHTSSPASEAKARQSLKSGPTCPPKITISTVGLDRSNEERRAEWPVLEVDTGSVNGPDDESNAIGLGIGMDTTGETNWSDWPAVHSSNISSSLPSTPSSEDGRPSSRAEKANATNGPPSPSPIARSPTMPNLATAHYYYGSAPTTPSPLGRFCTVATATGDMLEKVPDGRFPFPSPPPSNSSLSTPVSPIAKRRKSAGADIRMSTLVTTRYAGLSPMTPVITEDKSNASLSRKETMGGFHLLPLSKQTSSRRTRGGTRSPFYILLLPLIVIILHLYLSHVDKQFMDRGRNLVFGVPLRNSLAKLPDWLLKDVREEVFGQREGSKHGIFLLHQGEEDEVDHADEEALEAAWQTWSSEGVHLAETASSSPAEAATKMFAWLDEFMAGSKVRLDNVIGQEDVPARENVSL